MRGFDWGKGVNRCNFCGGERHNIRTCSLVEVVYETALGKLENDNGYQFSKKEAEAAREIKNREYRKTKPKNKRRKPKCSFCHKTTHKRPKCPKLKKQLDLFRKANYNWKKEFVARVNKAGFGVGCLVEMQRVLTQSWLEPESTIGVITSYDPVRTNIFCSLRTHSQYQSEGRYSVVLGNEYKEVNLRSLSPVLGGDIIYSGWWGDYSPKLISSSTWKPSEEWYSSQNTIFDWFYSQIEIEDVSKGEVGDIISFWSKQ